MLEVIVFTSGGVLLALEIVASRVLAPFFGNSVYVWGSLIGVFLAGLSLGYLVGGRVADYRPSPALFSALVFLAGALTFPIPLLSRQVMQALVLADAGPRAGPLAAATILFFLPTVVMGMVSPFAVRLRARTVSTVGNVAGVLYALSTLGSISGALVAAFVLLNAFGVRSIIHGLGVAMMVLAAAGLLVARRRPAAAAAGLAVVLATAGAAAAWADPGAPVVFERDTVYHRISVSDEGGVRYLRLDNYWQSALDLENPEREVFQYSTYMHLPVALMPRALEHGRVRVAMIGLGGGTVPRRYLREYPWVEVDVAELDPAVVETARRWFGLPASRRLRVVAEDGRIFLLRSPQRFHIILLDAYLIDTIPFHLATREFFELAATRLAPGGVVASNVIGALEGGSSRLFRAIYKTFRAVFPTVYVFPVGYGGLGSPELLRNIIIVGTAEPPLSPQQVLGRARVVSAHVEGLAEAAAALYTAPIRTDDVPLLTDDFAPVDALVSGR
ncbi:MAG: fused MFS/spermidine synthase [Armatimonadota bacterium]|nr:fused MFS/spermidine synthase [Armatimonadota bacterium]MDR7469454.1 fused MFS/spermidine synthase [Armatimonadota bacterium]MDR7473840.1 fused MFS/spermidine synthase [Armatimonadota bacterium]MDR7539101.1 fused MFS/spermidine synthase [Armatimonadota bacterium]